MRDTEEMLRNEIIYFKEIYNFGPDHFFIELITFLLSLKKAFLNIKNSILHQMYAGYGKNVKERNYLF